MAPDEQPTTHVLGDDPRLEATETMHRVVARYGRDPESFAAHWRPGESISQTNGVRIMFRQLSEQLEKGAIKKDAYEQRFKSWVGFLALWRRVYVIAAQAWPMARRARFFQASVDGVLLEGGVRDPEQAAAISCRAGCNACCRLGVSITRDEAALLADRVQGGVEVDRLRLAEQSTWPEEAPTWTKNAERALCVFQGPGGLCRVYDDRPMACRAYRVLSDPALCDPRNGAQQVLLSIEHRAELIAAAARTEQPVGLLPRMLLEALQRADRRAEKGRAR